MGANLDLFRFDDKILSDNVLNTDVLNTDVLNTTVFDRDEEVLGLNSENENITVLLYDGKKQISYNGDAFITSEPQMPSLKLKVVTDKYKKLFCKIKVSFERKYTPSGGKEIIRKIEKLLPEVGKALTITPNIDISDIFDWGNKIYGGKATIDFLKSEDDEKPIYTFSFNIKGTNPTDEEIKQYLIDKNYDWWFFKGIIKQESSGGHFAKRTETLSYKGIKFTNYKGEPYFGPPDGYGLMQIDRWDEYKKNKGLKNLDYIWNWKENIDEANHEIKRKIAETKEHLLKEIKKIKKAWEEDKSNVVAADDSVQGTITFKHTTVDYSGFEEINKYLDSTIVTDENNKSFIEANVIKRYNGGNFYSVVYDNNLKKWVWKVNDYSSQSGYYVKNVCSKLAWLLVLIFNFLISAAQSYESIPRIIDSYTPKKDTKKVVQSIKQHQPLDKDSIRLLSFINDDDSLICYQAGYINSDKQKDYIIITRLKTKIIDSIRNQANDEEYPYSYYSIGIILSNKNTFQPFCINNTLIVNYPYNTFPNEEGFGIITPACDIRIFKKKVTLTHNSGSRSNYIKYIFKYNSTTKKINISDVVVWLDRYQYYNGEHSILKKKNIPFCNANWRNIYIDGSWNDF